MSKLSCYDKKRACFYQLWYICGEHSCGKPPGQPSGNMCYLKFGLNVYLANIWLKFETKSHEAQNEVVIKSTNMNHLMNQIFTQ